MKTPDVSVVLPCLNEEKTIRNVIEKALLAFKKHNINGEVVVADNGSTDRSVAIATKAGARVVHQPVRGYGSAYQKGFAEARGRYLIMGDADDTYPMDRLNEFIQPLHKGYDFVIGDRFKGTIHEGAMPWHHYWIGNPVLSFIQRILFCNNIRDSHCGMRAFTKKAYDRLQLRTTGMEFASEMVIRASQEKLKIKQIPIDLYPRPGGSFSKLHSWRDGWRHLRFMLLFSPLYLFMIPGTLLILLGGIILGILARGPVALLGMTWDIHPMFVGAMLVMLGYQTILLGIFTKVYRYTAFKRPSDDDLPAQLGKFLAIDRGIVIGALLFLVGLAIDIHIVLKWIENGFANLDGMRLGIIAMTLVVVGVQTVLSACFLGILSVEHK